MRYVAALVLLVGLAVGPGWGQAVPADEPVHAPLAGQTDSATLSAILTEIRGIHKDVRLSETTQILLTEMEVQQGVVDKALAKRDAARQRQQQVQDQERQMVLQAARIDDQLTTVTDPQQKRQLAQMQDQFKQQQTMLKSQEPDRANDLAEAESTLRKEQDTLAGIQDQLNTVVAKLQP
jgi:hypothetical protein